MNIARETGLEEGVAIAALDLGKALRPAYPYAAIPLYQESLAAAKHVGFEDLASNALHNIGTAHLQLGAPEQAEGYLRESLRIRRTLQDERETANACNNLGIALLEQQKWDQAYDCCNEAIELYANSHNLLGQGSALANLAHIERRRGNRQAALDDYHEAIKLLMIASAPELAQVQRALRMMVTECLYQGSNGQMLFTRQGKTTSALARQY